MKGIYKYMVLAVALMLSTATMAQERVDEKLVYEKIRQKQIRLINYLIIVYTTFGIIC